MALVERLAILIDANAQGATREFRKLSGEAAKSDAQLSKTQKTLAGFKGALGAIGVTAAVAGLARFADQSIQAASALEEVEQKASVVFGTQFGQIQKFATDTADALNLSERAAYEFAAGFGQLFNSLGFGAQETAQLSSSLTTLAADVASFNNITVDEAFQKLRSGLSGEAEPLRQVGVFLSEAKVQAEAYSSGIAETGEKLTEAQKVQARYNIILRETKTAQGDVARTSESYANQQRNLNENLEDFRASLGEAIAPEAAKTIGILSDLLAVTTDLNDALSQSGGLPGALKDGLGGALTAVAPPVGVIIDQMDRLGEWLDYVRGDADDTAAAVAGLSEEIYYSGQGIEDIEPATRALLDSFEKAPVHIRLFADETAYLGDEADDAADTLKTLRDATEQLRSPALNLREANRDLADSIDDFHAEMRDGDSTQRDQERALDRIAESAFDVLNAYAETGASAGDLDRKTADLQEQLVDAAIEFGLTEQDAKDYATQLGLIPGSVTTSVVLSGIEDAIEQAKELQGLVSGLSVSELTSVVRQDEALANRRGRASGGPVGPGMYLVGERGPELLDLRGGTGNVYSNPKSRAMSASGGVTVNVGTIVAQDYRDMMRQLEQRARLANLVGG